jgi:hypothetical protein
MTQGQDQLTQRRQEALQRRLVGDPGFGVWKRLEDAPAMASCPRDNAPIYQKQQNGRRVAERHA